MELDKATFEDAAAAFLLDLPGSDAIDEKFDVNKLDHDEYTWDFMVQSKDGNNPKVHKALTKAGVEFSVSGNDGGLYVMGKDEDDKKAAIAALKSLGITESEIIVEKLNKKTLQVEEGDGEDIDDMIDDLADGDEDETQGPDDSAPDGEDSPESKIKDGESPEDATEGDDDASSKIAAATKELEKDSKKLAQLKKILLDESTTNEELTRMVNDGAMSELHLLAKEAKDEADFLKKAKSFAKDMDIKIEGGLEKMFKEFYSDMKNESVKETKSVTLDDDGKEVEDEENITDTKTGDEIQVEEPQEESTSNAYMDAVTEGLKHRFNK